MNTLFGGCMSTKLLGVRPQKSLVKREKRREGGSRRFNKPFSSLLSAQDLGGDLQGRQGAEQRRPVAHHRLDVRHQTSVRVEILVERYGLAKLCLLYTSDAAD